MRLFLAGPMRDRALFDEALIALRDQHPGSEVVSPFFWGDPTKDTPAALFLADLAELARCSDLVLLPGWRTSPGAVAELAFARALGGIAVHEYRHGRLKRFGGGVVPTGGSS